MNEQELVKAAQAGDFEAFSRLVGNHRDRIYRLALRLSRNREDAEDITQETFLKAVDNIDRFRSESSFGTWLYSIALNTFRAGAGEKKKMPLKSIEEYLPAQAHSEGNAAPELFDWGDPLELFERKELSETIESLLDDMPHKYSIPFILRYMEDLPVKEVSEALNLSVAATKSRILRARLALRDRLAEIFRERRDERV